MQPFLFENSYLFFIMMQKWTVDNDAELFNFLIFKKLFIKRKLHRFSLKFDIFDEEFTDVTLRLL